MGEPGTFPKQTMVDGRLTNGVDQRSFRDLAGRFPTGVVVISTDGGTGPVAMTANSFTSVCLEPPTVLMCVRSDSRTAQGIAYSGEFAVTILGEGQRHIADQFAVRGSVRFSEEARAIPMHGMPVIAGGIGYLGCLVRTCEHVGDHDVLFGEVQWVHGSAGRPLVFSRGAYDALAGRLQAADWCWYS